MPNAEEPSSPQKKGLTVSWALILMIIMLFFFLAYAGPKFAAYRKKSRHIQMQETIR